MGKTGRLNKSHGHSEQTSAISKAKRRATGKISNNNSNNEKSSEFPILTDLSRRQVIAQYHTIRKQLAAVDRDTSLPNEAARDARRRVLRARLAMIGGLDGYQAASLAGEEEHGGFDTSQWVIQYLSNSNNFNNNKSIRILDVGSIVHRFPNSIKQTNNDSPSLLQVDVTSIDLHPEDSRVIKADIIDFSKNHLIKKHNLFDVVSLCLCVNFEGCAFKRGDMLYATAQLVRTQGLVFFALPAPCIDNSRYMDEHRMTLILATVGLRVVNIRRSASLWLAVTIKQETQSSLTNQQDEIHTNLTKRSVLKGGEQRNNFTILLRAHGNDQSVDHDEQCDNKKEAINAINDDDDMSVVKQRNTDKRFDQQQRRQKSKRKLKKETQNDISQSLIAHNNGIHKPKLTSNQRRRARKKAYRKQKNKHK